MSDFIDRAILIATGFEKRAKEIVDDLAEAGKEETLGTSEKIQNKVVEESVNALRQVVAVLEEGKDKIEEELAGPMETLLDKFNLATKDDLDEVREMARIAREKVDELEKKIKG